MNVVAARSSRTSSAPRRDARWLSFIFVVCAVHVAYYFPRVVDDLFISLRYAENLAAGRGISFNPGERVEGYSSPLWMFLQAFGYLIGAEGVTFTKLLGLLSLGAIVLGLHRFARDVLSMSTLPTLLVCLSVALNSYVVDWALLGLETPLYLALLVWFPLRLRAYMAAPTRALGVSAGLTAVALAITRPEAPLYIAAVSLLELMVGVPSQQGKVAALSERLLAGLRLGLPVLLVLGLLLVARRSYFGLWLPHTYYVKGAGSGFELAKLGPLVSQGVGNLECALYVGGLLLALLMGLLQRVTGPLAIIVCSLFFTASVEQDWMPSLRHLLPLTLFAPLAWGWALERALDLALRPVRLGLVGLCSLVLLGAGIEMAIVDVRFSPNDHHGSRPWALPKSAHKWNDMLLSMRRIEPPHVTAMGSFDMGMITQNYYVLEASAAPLEKSWFIGRDIGKVGFYTEANVFDTPGLFTPDVVQSEAWKRDHTVDRALLQRAFAKQPVAAQLFDQWSPSAGRNPDLWRGYEVVGGGIWAPIDLLQNTQPVPAPEEILRRYERSLAKFPQWFYLNTLYGECVGAAMRKRTRIVREAVQRLKGAKQPDALSREQGAGASFEGLADLLGCTLEPAQVRPGEELKVSCFLSAKGNASERFLFFQHFHDPSGRLVFNGDHAPLHGLLPTTRWRVGQLISDVMTVRVPGDVAAGDYPFFIGMWKGDRRATALPVEMTDGQNRVRAGTLRITR